LHKVDSSLADKPHDGISNDQVNLDQDYLATGWYYLTNKGSGLERTLMGTEDVLFIDPNPIVTVKNLVMLQNVC
jgi:hypothetical protein